jgi:SSS family solute:Na+ symporter
MNISLFLILLFCLQLLYWAVGRRAARGLKGEQDYFLAGKNVRLFPLMMTFLATQVGGGVILGAADEAYQLGWPVLLYPLGAALGLILLGSGVGRRLAAFQVATVAQLFETIYGSAILKRIASLLSIVSLFMILVAQVIASHKFFISLGLTNTPLFILFWAIVIFYTAQGGLQAVISTDVVQGVFFSTIFLLAFGAVILFEPATALIQTPEWRSLEPVASKLCGWLFMPLCFMVIEQDMAQRCFAGASPKIVSRAAFLAGVSTMVVCIVPVFLGALAQAIGLEVSTGGSVLMEVIAKTTSPWISALVGCAVLAAIISTATSLINAISSNLSNDFKVSLFKKIDAVRQMQWITSLIAVGALFFAFYFDNIVGLLIQSYELSVSCLFIPVVMVLVRRQGSALSASFAVAAGAAGFVLLRLYPIDGPREVVSIGLSLLGYTFGEGWRRALYRHNPT